MWAAQRKNKQRPTVMLDGQLDAKDHKQIRESNEGEINRLVCKSTQLADITGEFKQLFEFGLSFLSNLYQHYVPASTPIKQKIASSIFSEKLIFEKISVEPLISTLPFL